MANVVGKPPVFDDPEKFALACSEYIESNKDTLTITGLALHLGFESRQSFYDYEQKPEYSYIVKSARLHIECGYEQSLRSQSVTGAIFALKNMGWKDKTATEISGPDGAEFKVTLNL